MNRPRGDNSNSIPSEEGLRDFLTSAVYDFGVESEVTISSHVSKDTETTQLPINLFQAAATKKKCTSFNINNLQFPSPPPQPGPSGLRGLTHVYLLVKFLFIISSCIYLK